MSQDKGNTTPSVETAVAADPLKTALLASIIDAYNARSKAQGLRIDALRTYCDGAHFGGAIADAVAKQMRKDVKAAYVAAGAQESSARTMANYDVGFITRYASNPIAVHPDGKQVSFRDWQAESLTDVQRVSDFDKIGKAKTPQGEGNAASGGPVGVLGSAFMGFINAVHKAKLDAETDFWKWASANPEQAVSAIKAAAEAAKKPETEPLREAA